MSIATELETFVRDGVQSVGELRILPDILGFRFVICHHADASLVKEAGLNGLEVHRGPEKARDLSTYAEDGTYRFAKAQTNLKRGWVMTLDGAEDLKLALDQFYPAAVGLFIAQKKGLLITENLRDKLNRQTGMYRFAKNISDAGAQQLVRETCGPAHQCAKKILWQLSDETSLEDSEASRYEGIPTQVPEATAIPLLCREACNHFVAECRKVSKQEADAAKAI